MVALPCTDVLRSQSAPFRGCAGRVGACGWCPWQQHEAMSRPPSVWLAALLLVPAFSTLAGSINLISTGTGALPPWQPTFDMGRSTIIEPCSDTKEPFNATLCAQYGICDYDWSNQKPLWSSAKPMNCSETLVEQARLTKAVNK